MICLAWGGVRHVLCWSSQEGAGATAMSEDWLCNLNHVKSPEMQKKKNNNLYTELYNFYAFSIVQMI